MVNKIEYCTFYSDFYSEELIEKMKKTKKKNKLLYEVLRKKIDEIMQNPERSYKNLRYDLSEFKRVHILKSFVLIFKVDIKNKTIRFEDFDHHDIIYKKRF